MGMACNFELAEWFKGSYLVYALWNGGIGVIGLHKSCAMQHGYGINAVWKWSVWGRAAMPYENFWEYVMGMSCHYAK